MTQKSTTNRVLLMAAVATLTSLPAIADETCFQRVAATRGFSLGHAVHAVPAPDGKSVFYLRSGPRDTHLGLYQFSLDSQQEHALALPAAAEHLSVEEKARRERARMTLSGITDFALSEDGHRLLVSQADKLSTIDLPAGAQTPVAGAGWIAPRLSPDGGAIAAVRDNDVHVVDLASGHDTRLTTGGSDTLTHGLADFAAAEELDRQDGIWWAPDGQSLVYEEANTAGVEKHFIADPEHPAVQPVEFRYPRAGTDNAKLRLGIIPRHGGKTVWIDWDHTAFPYVARVSWQKGGKLSLVLLPRLQTSEAVVSVDTATGKTTRLLTETDAAWVDLDPEPRLGLAGGKPLPYWLPDGSGFLWAGERGGVWQLELRRAHGSLDHPVTPRTLPFLSLNDVDTATGQVVVTANPDRLGSGVFRLPLAGGQPVAVSAAPGVNSAMAGEGQHTMLLVQNNGADGTAVTQAVDPAGKVLATLPDHAEAPPSIPAVKYMQVGALGLDAAVLHPSTFLQGKTYPVVLEVYAGPTVKVVLRAPRAYIENQCLADQGFIVVSIDGRGTPGRGRDFERATKFNLIDLPLQDQVDGLRAVGKALPEMDMHRVGVTGWSFGGYFTAMATIRRPDVFRAGVAGAPVVDFADYDTAYTERYLGLPQTDPLAYHVSNVLTYAAGLSRPLLIMHGLTDDNVYFENTVKLTQALITAGKPYNLLLLPGTHLLSDPVLRARVDEARAGFFAEHLK